MTEGASLLMELYRLHMYAARDLDKTKRERLYKLIEDFEWAFPQFKKEIDAIYPQGEADER